MARRVLILALVAVAIACTKTETSTAPAETAPAEAAAVPATTQAAPAVPAAPAPTASPAAPAAVASTDGEAAGTRLEVTEVRRTSGGTLNVKFTMINDGAEPMSFGWNFGETNNNSDYGTIGGTHLIDQVNRKKYHVVRDAGGNCVCSSKLGDVPPGGRVNVWAKFPAPPDDVSAISIVVPKFVPLDDVPISR